MSAIHCLKISGSNLQIHFLTWHPPPHNSIKQKVYSTNDRILTIPHFCLHRLKSQYCVPVNTPNELIFVCMIYSISHCLAHWTITVCTLYSLAWLIKGVWFFINFHTQHNNSFLSACRMSQFPIWHDIIRGSGHSHSGNWLPADPLSLFVPVGNSLGGYEIIYQKG